MWRTRSVLPPVRELWQAAPWEVPVAAGWPFSAFSRGLATHGVADTNTSTSGILRFYKTVGVESAADQSGFVIKLDNRVLKSPAKRPLVVPTQALALAIAAEWEWQIRRIDTNTMPLMSLAATAIDQPQPRDLVIEAMLQFVSTDPVVCRLERGAIADKQAATLDPVLEWARREIGVGLQTTDSIFGADVKEEDEEKLRRYVQALSPWELTAAEQLAASCKSVCMALAAVKGVMGVHDVVKASRLEEEHQIEEWGLVEGGHDIDASDIKVRVSAPSVFLRLLQHH